MSFLKPAHPTRGRKQRQTAIKRQVSTLPITLALTNLRSLTALALAEGYNSREWYTDAREFALALSEEYDLPLPTTVGIIAALSPSTAWERNMILAVQLIETNDCAHVYGVQIEKARTILNGADPQTILKGRKEKSFAHNMLNPSAHGHVTLDRHATTSLFRSTVEAQELRNAGMRSVSLDDKAMKVLNKPGAYILLSAVFRTVARENNLTACQLQAITWNYWRDRFAHDTNLTLERF